MGQMTYFAVSERRVSGAACLTSMDELQGQLLAFMLIFFVCQACIPARKAYLSLESDRA